MGVLQEEERTTHQHQGHQHLGKSTGPKPKAPIRGSSAVSSLDCLLADMESFKSQTTGPNGRGRKLEIEVENKKEEDLERKLDNLTDKLLGSLKTGGQDPEEEKSDLGKCSACDKTIEDASVLVNGKPSHPNCFSCSTCHKAIDGKFFTEPDGGFLCELCYQQTREKCDHCKLPLLDRVLTAMEKKFHPSCFRCALCDVALEGVPFLISGGAVNCQACYTKYKAAQCVRCNQGIVNTGTTKTNLVTCQGKNYHEQCYTCSDCTESLSGQFVCAAPNDEIVCFQCDTKRRG